LVLKKKRLRNYGTDTAGSEQAGQGSDEVDGWTSSLTTPYVPVKVENRRASGRSGHGIHWREGGNKVTYLLKET